MRSKIHQGYVKLLLVTTLSKFQIMLQLFLILQHQLMGYVWNRCDLAAKSTFQLTLPYVEEPYEEAE